MADLEIKVVILNYEDWLISVKEVVEECYNMSVIRHSFPLEDYLTDRYEAYLHQFVPIV